MVGAQGAAPRANGHQPKQLQEGQSPPPPPRPPLPARVLSKGCPRRRTATTPCAAPDASSRGGGGGGASKKTRDEPDLSVCHCCGARFPLPPPGGAKRRPLGLMRSQWRIVLLCPPCLSRVGAASVCSYCLSLENLPAAAASITCLRCHRCVHLACIPNEHRVLPLASIDLENFVCIDCCPIPKLAKQDVASTASLEVAAREAAAMAKTKAEFAVIAREKATRKAAAANCAMKRAKDALGAAFVASNQELVGEGSDSVVPDEKLALLLHLEMNGSQRILRCGSSRGLGGGPVGSSKGRKGVLGRMKGFGDGEICVTNRSPLDAVEDGTEPGSMIEEHFEANPVRQFDSSTSLVLALECPRVKRKGPSGTAQENGCTDRYMKKYSKRNSGTKAKVGKIEGMFVQKGQDIGSDASGGLAEGSNGVAPTTEAKCAI